MPSVPPCYLLINMKTKILHIIPNLRKGGAERLVIDIVRNLSKHSDIDVNLGIFREEILSCLCIICEKKFSL